MSTSLLGAGMLLQSGVFERDGEVVAGPTLDGAQTGYGPGYRIYECGDGQWFALVVPDAASWAGVAIGRRRSTRCPRPTFARLRGGVPDDAAGDHPGRRGRGGAREGVRDRARSDVDRSSERHRRAGRADRGDGPRQVPPGDPRRSRSTASSVASSRTRPPTGATSNRSAPCSGEGRSPTAGRGPCSRASVSTPSRCSMSSASGDVIDELLGSGVARQLGA